MSRKHTCAACGGTLIKEFIMYDKRWGNDVAVYEDVPAMVCPQCGEVWIDGKVLERMEKIFLKREKPTHTRRVPVWSLKAA